MKKKPLIGLALVFAGATVLQMTSALTAISPPASTTTGNIPNGISSTTSTPGTNTTVENVSPSVPTVSTDPYAPTIFNQLPNTLNSIDINSPSGIRKQLNSDHYPRPDMGPIYPEPIR